MSQAGSATGGGGGGSGILTLNYVTVTTTPYVVQSNDTVMGVNTTSLSITVQLPDAPHVGRVYVIKDLTGFGAVRNITVTTVSGTVLVEASTSFVMNTSFESIQVLFNGTKYLVF